MPVNKKKAKPARSLFDDLESDNPGGSVPIPPQAFGSPFRNLPNPLRWTHADEVAEELALQLESDRPSRERMGRALEFGIYLLKDYEQRAIAKLFIALVNADRESVE